MLVHVGAAECSMFSMRFSLPARRALTRCAPNAPCLDFDAVGAAVAGEEDGTVAGRVTQRTTVKAGQEMACSCVHWSDGAPQGTQVRNPRPFNVWLRALTADGVQPPRRDGGNRQGESPETMSSHCVLLRFANAASGEMAQKCPHQVNPPATGRCRSLHRPCARTMSPTLVT